MYNCYRLREAAFQQCDKFASKFFYSACIKTILKIQNIQKNYLMKSKHSNHFRYLGKNRSQIMAEIGNQSNNYLSDIWNCHIKTNWFGIKTLWIIFFENGKVCKIKIKKTF